MKKVMIKGIAVMPFVFASVILIGATHFAFADVTPGGNPFCGSSGGWPAPGTYELPIVAALTAVDYITTDYVSAVPFPIPGAGLINDILIDFQAIANNLIIARSITWVLGAPVPIPGPGKVQVRDAAIAQALQIVKGLEQKISRAFSPYFTPEQLAPLLEFRMALEGWISGAPVPIP